MKQQPCSKNIASQSQGFFRVGARPQMFGDNSAHENLPKPYFILGRRRKKSPNPNPEAKSAKCL